MCGKIIAFVLLVALGNAAHAGDIFRCVSANGDAMFTNMACPANDKVEHVASYTPVPDAPTPAYSKPSFEPVVGATPSAAQSQAAYQAGYEQAQADAQEESSSDENAYAGGWIPYYGGGRASHREHNHHHHDHSPKTMATQTPAHSLPFVATPRR